MNSFKKTKCNSEETIPYGLMWDENKLKVIEDTAAISIVKQIFEFAEQGKSAQNIAGYLNACCVLTPEQYKSKMLTGDGRGSLASEKWDKSHVRCILKDKRYKYH